MAGGTDSSRETRGLRHRDPGLVCDAARGSRLACAPAQDWRLPTPGPATADWRLATGDWRLRNGLALADAVPARLLALENGSACRKNAAPAHRHRTLGAAIKAGAEFFGIQSGMLQTFSSRATEPGPPMREPETAI